MAANSKERGGGRKKLEAVGKGRAPPGLETRGDLNSRDIGWQGH